MCGLFTLWVFEHLKEWYNGNIIQGCTCIVSFLTYKIGFLTVLYQFETSQLILVRFTLVSISHIANAIL
jgi:hypothetical protein